MYLFIKNQNIATLLPKAGLAPTAVRVGFNNSIKEKIIFYFWVIVIVIK